MVFIKHSKTIIMIIIVVVVVVIRCNSRNESANKRFSFSEGVRAAWETLYVPHFYKREMISAVRDRPIANSVREDGETSRL